MEYEDRQTIADILDLTEKYIRYHSDPFDIPCVLERASWWIEERRDEPKTLVSLIDLFDRYVNSQWFDQISRTLHNNTFFRHSWDASQFRTFAGIVKQDCVYKALKSKPDWKSSEAYLRKIENCLTNGDCLRSDNLYELDICK